MKGTWVEPATVDDEPACRIGDLQLDFGLTLTVGNGVTLYLEGGATLTNDGTIDNLGTINDELGNVCNIKDRGVVLGNAPTPNGAVDCALSGDAEFCLEDLGGTWREAFADCTINNLEIRAEPESPPLTIPPGFTLYVTGRLDNFATLNNEGTIIDQNLIANNEGAILNNYGSILTDLAFDSAGILNLGTIDNYGSIDIDPGGAFFDNADQGLLINRCSATYTGTQPVDGVENEECEAEFLRGDCNADGSVDISDSLFTLGSLFLGENEGDLGCDDACDSNDDGTVDISDAISTLGALFLGSEVIPLPGTMDCGIDPTQDETGCDTFEPCP